MNYEKNDGESWSDYTTRRMSEVRAGRNSPVGQAMLDIVEAGANGAYEALLGAESAEEAWASLKTLKAVGAILEALTTKVDEHFEVLDKRRFEEIKREEAARLRENTHRRNLRNAGQP